MLYAIAGYDIKLEQNLPFNRVYLRYFKYLRSEQAYKFASQTDKWIGFLYRIGDIFITCDPSR